MKPTCQQTAVKTKSINDLNHLFPFISTKENLTQNTEAEIISEIGHEIHATLVFEKDGNIEYVTKEDLKCFNLKIEQAFEIAFINLDTILNAQIINMSKQSGPNNQPFLHFSNHWLSASSLLNPSVLKLAKKELGANTLLASIPNNEGLYIFPKCDGEQLISFEEMIKEKESKHKKWLTKKLFYLNGSLSAHN